MSTLIKSRRNFLKYALKNTLTGAAGLTAYSLLSSCSSFDDYFFDDGPGMDDEVMIIGGGISGLYLAAKLRGSKTQFRLFEGSNYFGGRIKSYEGMDYGASVLSQSDSLAKQLVKDLSLQTKTLNKDFLYLPDGMQALPNLLVERTVGLIPYRSFRLRWKLIEIQKYKSGFNLTFQHPTGLKRFNCKKIALAIPPSQWKSVKGLLDLPEMNWAQAWLAGLKAENTIKIILPGSALNSPYINVSYQGFDIRQIIKKKASLDKAAPLLEIDVRYQQKTEVSADDIYTVVKKGLQLNYPFQKLAAEQFYDWSQVDLIKGSNFSSNSVIPEAINPNFQIVGDFMASDLTASRGGNGIEAALKSAKQAAELLL